MAGPVVLCAFLTAREADIGLESLRPDERCAMPQLTLRGSSPSFDTQFDRSIVRLEGPRLSDDDCVLAEFEGSFWISRHGTFSGIEFQRVNSIHLESHLSPALIIGPQRDVRIAGDAFWNGETLVAQLEKTCWVTPCGGVVSAIVLHD
jgi:hypothetical protein